MGTGQDRLRQLFDSEVPCGIAELDDAQLIALADAIDATRRRQADALARAAEDGLAMIPRVLRGPVRKVLSG